MEQWREKTLLFEIDNKIIEYEARKLVEQIDHLNVTETENILLEKGKGV